MADPVMSPSDYEWRRDPLGKIGGIATNFAERIGTSLMGGGGEIQPQPTPVLEKSESVIPQIFSGYRTLQEEAAKQLGQSQDDILPMLARPPEEPGIQQRALQASQQRYAQTAPSTPPALQGQYGGTYFGPEYEAAVASGKFTPQQIAAAEVAKARYASTPLGLTAQRLGLESESRKADLTYAGKEQEALALAAERENKAREAAEVSDRAQMERFEQMRSEFDQAQAKRIRDMDDLRTEIATTKIDPAQYFAKGNGFGNALSLLSVALGGFAEGYSGGRLKNNALAMLQNSIAQDIEAQKANLANKRGALAESQSLYGMARQRFGDDQAATEYTKARQNELLKNQALRFANEGRTDAIRANAQKLAQHFDLESKLSDNRVKQMFADAEAERIKASVAAQYSAQLAAEKRREKGLDLEKKRLENLLLGQKIEEGMPGETEVGALKKISKEVAETYIPNAFASRNADGTISYQGAFMPGIGKEQAAKIVQQQKSLDEVEDILKRMEELPDKGYTGYWTPSNKQLAQTLSSEYVGKINAAQGLGAYDVGTAQLLKEQNPLEKTDTQKFVALALRQTSKSRARNVPNAVPGTLTVTNKGYLGSIGDGQPSQMQPAIDYTKGVK